MRDSPPTSETKFENVDLGFGVSRSASYLGAKCFLSKYWMDYDRRYWRDSAQLEVLTQMQEVTETAFIWVSRISNEPFKATEIPVLDSENELTAQPNEIEELVHSKSSLIVCGNDRTFEFSQEISKRLSRQINSLCRLLSNPAAATFSEISVMKAVARIA